MQRLRCQNHNFIAVFLCWSVLFWKFVCFPALEMRNNQLDFHGGSLEILLTVPLKRFYWWICYIWCDAVIVNSIRLIDFTLILKIFKCCSEQLVWFGGIRSNSLVRLFIFWEPVYSLPAFSLFHLGGFTGPYSVTKRIPYCLNNHFFLFFFISRKYGNQGYIFSW